MYRLDNAMTRLRNFDSDISLLFLSLFYSSFVLSAAFGTIGAMENSVDLLEQKENLKQYIVALVCFFFHAFLQLLILKLKEK